MRRCPSARWPCRCSAANEGYLDDVPVEKIVAFEAALHAHAADKYAHLIDSISSSGNLDDEIIAGLKGVVEDFKRSGAY